MFNLMKAVRNKPVEEVRRALAVWLDSESERLDGIATFSLTKQNRGHIHYLLARMTAWLDEELGIGRTFAEYVDRERSHPFEVEHIWANHYDRHADEFSSQAEFEDHRNRFGDLLLLPKDFNASYGDMAYERKLEHYNAQNSLARSLHPLAYVNNPSFLRAIREYDLPFEPHPNTFTKAGIGERQGLYQQLAEIIWDPARLGITADVLP
jgi:hypothetical protein